MGVCKPDRAWEQGWWVSASLTEPGGKAGGCLQARQSLGARLVGVCKSDGLWSKARLGCSEVVPQCSEHWQLKLGIGDCQLLIVL